MTTEIQDQKEVKTTEANTNKDNGFRVIDAIVEYATGKRKPVTGRFADPARTDDFNKAYAALGKAVRLLRAQEIYNHAAVALTKWFASLADGSDVDYTQWDVRPVQSGETSKDGIGYVFRHISGDLIAVQLIHTTLVVRGYKNADLAVHLNWSATAPNENIGNSVVKAILSRLPKYEEFGSLELCGHLNAPESPVLVSQVQAQLARVLAILKNIQAPKK